MAHPRRDGENPDMEISPDSTPTSEPSYASPGTLANSSNIPEDPSINAASPNGHVLSKHHNQSTASASRLSKQNSTVASSSSPHYHSSHHHRHRSVSPLNDVDVNNSNSIRNSPAYNNVPVVNNHLIGDGPPTPEMDLAGDHRRSKLPAMSRFSDEMSNLSDDGAPGGVSSLQSVMSAASQVNNRLNLLTPSLAKFFRVDLLNHVTNWPSEMLEKQVRQKTAII
jgi:WW domain-containing adapter protein with coiled-coil